MLNLYVANPKGGCGKTTIAAQLAAFFSSAGIKTAIIDHDAQKSSTDWVSQRPSNLSSISVHKDPKKLDDEVQLCIHDMPAAWAITQGSEWFKNGDKLLIPVLPSSTDIKACIRFLMALQRAGLPELGVDLALVANRAKARTNYYRTLIEFLERVDWPLLTTLRDTQNYIRAMDSGQSVFEMAHSKVRKDLEQWQPLIDWVADGLDGIGSLKDGFSKVRTV